MAKIKLINKAKSPKIKPINKKKNNKKHKLKKQVKAEQIKIETDSILNEPKQIQEPIWSDHETINEQSQDYKDTSESFTNEKTISSPERILAVNKALRVEYIKAASYAAVASGGYYLQYKGKDHATIRILSAGAVWLLILSAFRINNLQKTKQSFMIHGFSDSNTN